MRSRLGLRRFLDKRAGCFTPPPLVRCFGYTPDDSSVLTLIKLAGPRPIFKEIWYIHFVSL